MFDPSKLKQFKSKKKSVLSLEETQKAVELIKQGYTRKSVAEAFGISGPQLSAAIKHHELEPEKGSIVHRRFNKELQEEAKRLLETESKRNVAMKLQMNGTRLNQLLETDFA